MLLLSDRLLYRPCRAGCLPEGAHTSLESNPERQSQRAPEFGHGAPIGKLPPGPETQALVKHGCHESLEVKERDLDKPELEDVKPGFGCLERCLCTKSDRPAQPAQRASNKLELEDVTTGFRFLQRCPCTKSEGPAQLRPSGWCPAPSSRPGRIRRRAAAPAPLHPATGCSRQTTSRMLAVRLCSTRRPAGMSYEGLPPHRARTAIGHRMGDGA